MIKIVAAVATMHAQQLFVGLPQESPKQLAPEPTVTIRPQPVGCLMTLHVLQAEQRLLQRGLEVH